MRTPSVHGLAPKDEYYRVEGLLDAIKNDHAVFSLHTFSQVSEAHMHRSKMNLTAARLVMRNTGFSQSASSTKP